MSSRDPHSRPDRPGVPPSGRASAPWDLDDPRWSAYLLGEMSQAERLAVEAILEENPDARREFEDLADAADLIRLAFEAEPSPVSPPLRAKETPSPLPIIRAADVDDAVSPAADTSLVSIVPPKNRRRPGGSLVFFAAVASLGLCLVLVVQSPRRPDDRRLATRSIVPTGVVTTVDTSDFAALSLQKQTATFLATSSGSAHWQENAPHAFRLTPSLALSYYSGWADSAEPVDPLTVSAPHFGSQGDVPDRSGINSRLRTLRENLPTNRFSWDAQAATPEPLERGVNQMKGTTARGGSASYDRPGESEVDASRQQFAREAESRPQAVPELREVLLVSRFQTPATVPVAAIPVQVGRQSMVDIEKSLARGEWPAPESIRLEELVNAFDYDDPLPTGDSIAELRVEGGPCPWNERHRLVRVGLRAEPVDLTRRPTFRAVFVVDSRRPETVVKFNESLAEASQHFSSLDRVTVVDASGSISLPTIAGDQLGARLRSQGRDAERFSISSGVPATPTSGAASGQTAPGSAAPVQSLGIPAQLSGGSAGAATPTSSDSGGKVPVFSMSFAQQPQVALENAYGVARETFIAGANNSVVLLTDEPLQSTATSNTLLMENVRSYADSGVNLNVLDVNANYGNTVLHDLVDVGNGRVNTVSTPDELSEAVVQELAGGKSVVATDVQLQIEFNPVRVEAYRLLGYEHWNREPLDPRLLAGQKELRAGDRLCAVVEVRLNPETSATLASLPLRYRQSTEFFVDADVQDGERPLPPVDHDKEWLTARLIYTRSGSSLQSVREVPFDGDGGTSSSSLDWAGCVVDFGERLKQPERLTTVSLQGIRRRAEGLTGPDPLGTRQRFLTLLDQAIDLTRRTPRAVAGPAALSSVEARSKATCEGRYRDLLDKIAVPGDHARYGTFHDRGFQPMQSYLGHADLPAGYWVYVYPHWYIWGSAESQVFMAAPPSPAQSPQPGPLP